MAQFAGKADALMHMADHLELVRSSAVGARSRLQLRNMVGEILNKVLMFSCAVLHRQHVALSIVLYMRM